MAPQELALRAAMDEAQPKLVVAYENRDYLQYLKELLPLVPSINDFLDNVRILK